MWVRTLRGRLTLWNLAVLVVTLVLFGLVMNFTNQQRLLQDVDNDLRHRAEPLARRPPPPPQQDQDGFGGGPSGDFGGGPPGDFGGPNPFPGERPPPPQERPAQGQGPLGYLRNPEVFSLKGELLRPTSSDDFHPKPFDSDLLREALAGRTAFATTQFQGMTIRVAALPMTRGGQLAGVVETARDISDFQDLSHGQMLTLLILCPLAVAIAGLGAFFLTNRALKPIGAASAAAEQISESDMSKRLPVEGGDELAHLSGTFNRMLDRLQTSFENLREAYEHQRRFTGDASHELRTPLTRLKLATSAALLEAGIPPAVLESIRIADQSADAMSKIVEQLLVLSKADAGQLSLQKSVLDLRVVAAEALDSLPSGGSRIEVDLPDQPLLVCADQDYLKRAILNLLQNAVRHTPEGKKIRLSAGSAEGKAFAVVDDEGEGIAKEHLSHLGERFYRVDQARSRAEGGFGLGLSICKSIIEAHHGRLQIESILGKGTTATIWIPLAST